MPLVVYVGATPTDGTSVLSWHREEPPFLIGYKPSRMVTNLTMGARLSYRAPAGEYSTEHQPDDQRRAIASGVERISVHHKSQPREGNQRTTAGH